LFQFFQCFCYWVFVFLVWGLIEWLVQVAVADSSADSDIGGQLNSGVNESNLLSGNGTIPRTNSGCGYVSSTTTAMTYEPCVSCTTFNILAPIYKRLDQKVLIPVLVPFVEPDNGVNSSSCFFLENFENFICVLLCCREIESKSSWKQFQSSLAL
jgi:hypothetical protein